jgi:PAS domain S-box-containing protein
VIDLNSEIITANDRGKAHFEAADKQEMFRLGLLGIETTKLIVHQLDQEALELMLTAVTAVRDEDGNFVGAILVGRQLDSDQLAHLNFNREDVHLLLIHDSQVVVQDSVSIAKKEEHNHQIETQDNHLVLDGTEIDTAVLQQVLSGSSSSVIPGNNPDFPQVIALSPLPVPSDYPLILAVQIGQVDLATFTTVLVQNGLFLIFGLIIFLIIMVSFFTRANITRPIRNLTAVSAHMAEGNYTQRIEAYSEDELGQLGRAFNRMAGAIERRDTHLSELNATLEHRVAERTAELEQTNVQLQQEVFERQKAERNLRQQRTFLRQILDINPNFIFAKDRDGRFTLVNKAFADAYKTTPTEMIGKSDANYNPDSVRVEEFRHDDLKVMDSLEDKFIPEETTTTAATGEQRWLQTLKRPIMNENGRADQVLVVVTDITDRKQVQDQLAVARDKALQASQLKTQLLANVSHDLRTPLNVILGYIELLQLGIYGQIPEKQQPAIQQMMESTRQLLEFVNNLLSQAQIESGEMHLRAAPFNLPQNVNRVKLALELLAHSKGIELTSKIDPNVPEELMGSETWVNQILINLVSNAIKFTEQGSVDIHVHQPDSASWAISVSDTGDGISEEAQATIFEAFQQVDGSVTRGRGGSGLGLSIVDKLTTLMGGEIHLNSSLGTGSTFTVTFPLTLPKEKKQ